jgi:hypothetical protein
MAAAGAGEEVDNRTDDTIVNLLLENEKTISRLEFCRDVLQTYFSTLPTNYSVNVKIEHREHFATTLDQWLLQFLPTPQPHFNAHTFMDFLNEFAPSVGPFQRGLPQGSVRNTAWSTTGNNILQPTDIRRYAALAELRLTDAIGENTALKAVLQSRSVTVQDVLHQRALRNTYRAIYRAIYPRRNVGRSNLTDVSLTNVTHKLRMLLSETSRRTVQSIAEI